MIYLTLVIFFGFLLLVWFLVKLLFRLQEKDTYEFDSQYLWENFKKNKKDMHYPKKK
ncbi:MULTISPECIES: hypothetical protein [Brevibacillus]|uniref:hypothetical protein n=1 Tax=Brevibacillus TaxID=55080 RepID=UPI001605AC37|nr:MULTISPECIES: hypothetical protein [Brevibacillus]MCM3081430.1 hypothetical protein [Brevibacillus invocatus]MCM3431793.1 hypothetical protein [Brevibacillus invocatus]MDH4619271.1 hypothetical protein [Brevibacillus sp. AY1]